MPNPTLNLSDPPNSAWEDDVVMLGYDTVSDYKEDYILPQSPDTLNKIRNWLQPINYDDEGSEYKKHLSSHLAGTGGWLISSTAYQEWNASHDYGMLWIRGTVHLL